MKYQPIYWKPEYPDYATSAGWEKEKSVWCEIIRLQLRFAMIEVMINKSHLQFKAAFMAKDTRLMLKYNLITERLYIASNRIAMVLICDYKQTLKIQ